MAAAVDLDVRIMTPTEPAWFDWEWIRNFEIAGQPTDRPADRVRGRLGECMGHLRPGVENLK